MRPEFILRLALLWGFWLLLGRWEIVHRGLSRFLRRRGYCAANPHYRRENGTVPLMPPEGDRSMFSANVVLAKHDFSPKNGPVPNRTVNAYGRWERNTATGSDPQRVFARIPRLRAFITGAVVITVLGAAIETARLRRSALAAGLLRYYWFRLTDVALPLGVALEGVALVVVQPSRLLDRVARP